MKIIYLITKSNWGGAQKYVYDLATGLERDKFEVKVVAGGRGVLIEELRKKGIETISLPPLQENTNFIKTVISLKNAAALLRLAKIFWKEKPQIVHLNSSKIAGLGAVAAWFVKTLRAQRMDIVMTVHGWPFLEDRPRWEQLIIKFLSKLTARFQNKIILINTLDLNIAESFLPQKKLNLIFNGNAPIDFLTRPAARAFLSSQIGSTDETGEIFIGNNAELTKNKGQIYLIEAAKALKERGIKFKLFIISGGEDREKLEKKIKACGLGRVVFLLGFVPNAKRYLKGFDIFIMPSLKEGLPYAIMEAMQAEIAVVASKVGGVTDLIQDRKNGLLIPPADAKAISETLNFLIDHPEERARLGEQGAADAKTRFNLDKMLKKTSELYETN
ncbi:MAG TPA: glycosyltransferase [Candidatus Paceibacterota bacterium]